MLESMQRRLNKVHAEIDNRYEEQVDNILSIVVENESTTRKMAKKALKNVCGNRSGKGNDAPTARMVNARVYAAQIRCAQAHANRYLGRLLVPPATIHIHMCRGTG